MKNQSNEWNGSTKKPPDWKAFLANDANKTQFIAIIYKEWSKDEYAEKFRGQEVTLVCEGSAYRLTSEDGLTTKRLKLIASNLPKKNLTHPLSYVASMLRRKGTNMPG